MIKVGYTFEGGRVPGKFYQDIYTCVSAPHMFVVEGRNTSWGDDHEVIVTADCIETLDYYLEEWKEHKTK